MMLLIPAHESLTIEFKRDWQRLPGSELVEAQLCLANTDDGELWLGVEVDGSACGLHTDHQSLTVGGVLSQQGVRRWARYVVPTEA